MDIFVLLQSVLEPGFMEADLIIVLDKFAFEGVLEGDVTAILLTEEGPDYWGAVLAEGVPGDIV